jgi:hypothetical protein
MKTLLITFTLLLSGAFAQDIASTDFDYGFERLRSHELMKHIENKYQYHVYKMIDASDSNEHSDSEIADVWHHLGIALKGGVGANVGTIGRAEQFALLRKNNDIVKEKRERLLPKYKDQSELDAEQKRFLVLEMKNLIAHAKLTDAYAKALMAKYDELTLLEELGQTRSAYNNTILELGLMSKRHQVESSSYSEVNKSDVSRDNIKSENLENKIEVDTTSINK